MAVGWSRDGAVQEQIDATVEAGVQLESDSNRGLEELIHNFGGNLLKLDNDDKRVQYRGLPASRMDSPDKSDDLATTLGA
jgi:hypothetical protein